MSTAVLRLFAIALAGALVVAGCSTSNDATSSTSSSDTTSSAEETVDESTTTVDNRTEEEIALDRLDVMMFSVGVTDLEGTSNCVVDRLESENIAFSGDGTSELIALFGCDASAISQWLPATSPVLPPDAWSCTVASVGDWIGGLTIPETEEFFAAAVPPTEFTDQAAVQCEVSSADLIAALS